MKATWHLIFGPISSTEKRKRKKKGKKEKERKGKKERKEQKERILGDINLGDDIETMAKILDLTSRNDFELQLDDHIYSIPA